MSALYAAFFNKTLKPTQLLILKGANPKGYTGQRPIRATAVDNGDIDIVECFLQAKVNVND